MLSCASKPEIVGLRPAETQVKVIETEPLLVALEHTTFGFGCSPLVTKPREFQSLYSNDYTQALQLVNKEKASTFSWNLNTHRPKNVAVVSLTCCLSVVFFFTQACRCAQCNCFILTHCMCFTGCIACSL